ENGVFSRKNIYDFRGYLEHEETWYIVDGRKPMDYVAKTILICSPMKDHYRNFDKLVGTTIRYMPVWEWEEVDACRTVIYNHLKESEVKQLFLKWGGIPRFVLEKASDPTQQNTLEDAIARFNYIGKSDSRDEVSHKLIHICTNPLIDESEDDGSDIEVESGEEVEYVDEEPYTLKTITFASDYVGEKVTEKLKISILDKLRTQFELSLTEGINNPYLGSCFEQIAHRMLRNGGTFKVRSLENNDDGTLNKDIKKQNEILTFSAVQTIEDGKYYRPDNKNFPSIDAIIAPDMLFQMTTAINHPIKIIGLKKLVSKLARTGEISFYFVVPAELYDRYQNQKFIATNNANIRRMPSWIKNRVKQYALRIDLSSESSSSESSLKRKCSSSGGASSSKKVKK
ncbi:17099_t:CDS:1, partial [Acaulospora colombiana]